MWVATGFWDGRADGEGDDPEYLYEHSETVPREQAAAADPAGRGAAEP